MRFESVILVDQTVEQVWNFLSDPTNSSKWDKSVDQVILPESGFTGLGCIVDTISPSGMRHSFKITEFSPPHFLKFQLLKSAMFKEAELIFLIEKVNASTKITHIISLKLSGRWLFLYPILLLTNKKALSTDMQYLKTALNNYTSI